MNEKYMSASGLHNALQYYNTRAVIANIFFFWWGGGGDQVFGNESNIYSLIKLLISISSAQKPTG